MKNLKAFINKNNINKISPAEQELVCICVDPRYSNNESITSLIQQHYALNLNNNSNIEVFIMNKEDLIRFARKYSWSNFSVLAPKMKTWSREDIIKALRANKKLQNFSFISQEIEKEVKNR